MPPTTFLFKKETHDKKTKKNTMNSSIIPETDKANLRLLLSDRIVLMSARCPWFTFSPVSSTLSWMLGLRIWRHGGGGGGYS